MIYDYKCHTCNVVVEEVRSINDESELLCAVCGDPMQRIITTCNFVLKGSWTGRDITEKKERESNSEKRKLNTQERVHYNNHGF